MNYMSLLLLLLSHSLWEKGPIEGVLFDIDGTLCDSDPLHFYAFRQMLQQVLSIPHHFSFLFQKVNYK